MIIWLFPQIMLLCQRREETYVQSNMCKTPAHHDNKQKI